MNKTIALVNAWGDFETRHPNGSIDDFCRHYLASHGKPKMKGPMAGGVIPPNSAALLLKLIGRIHKLNMSYMDTALKGTGLKQIEEFGMLLTIEQEKNPRKTDIIYANLFELSSGTDMLNRLIKRNLIKQKDDPEDKRSKRIELTQAGEKAIALCILRAGKVARMMTGDLSEDDRQLAIHLLKNTEIKFSARWQEDKGKSFDGVYNKVMEGGRTA
jgi:DNA-binding MarR family transcriptional regulator